MTDNSKNKVRNIYNSTLLTIILGLLGYIGVMMQSSIENLNRKVEKRATIEYVDRQDDYLRLHIVQSHKIMDDKLDIYINQNNKVQELIKQKKSN